MSRFQATLTMILVTLLWSMAGIVSRQLESAASFEIAFWRSAFNGLFLGLLLTALRGANLWRGLLAAPRVLWLSSLCWSVMFSAFMLALTLTTVANTLVIMALSPVLTAVLAVVWLGRRISRISVWAITVAAVGMVGMFAEQLLEGISMTGSLIALAVPLAAAINWNLLQRERESLGAAATDLMPAVFVGAVISALVMGALAWPFQATSGDIAWLAFLGVFQLALPCLLVVHVARFLPSHEIALIGLLEIVFGVAWAWIGAGERPAVATFLGGLVVIVAVLVNIWAQRAPDDAYQRER